MKGSTTCERYLGVRVGLTGEMMEEFTYRVKQSRKFAEVVSKLQSREEAVFAWRSYYMPKFSYPLPITTFTTEQLAKIESPAVNALLSKMGYNRHMCSTVVFGPLEYGGLGLKSLPFQQLFYHNKWLITIIRSQTQIGPLLHILLRHSQLESGTRNILSDKTDHRTRIVKYLTPSWITSVAMEQANANLSVDFAEGAGWCPPLQRENDEYLMEIFLTRVPHFTTSQLRGINRVRMYLRVYALSCIIEGRNTQWIVHWATSYRFCGGTHRTSTWQWPNSEKPKNADWVHWRKGLQHIESRGVRLGRWMHCHQKWMPHCPAPRIHQSIVLYNRPNSLRQYIETLPHYYRRVMGNCRTSRHCTLRRDIRSGGGNHSTRGMRRRSARRRQSRKLRKTLFLR